MKKGNHDQERIQKINEKPGHTKINSKIDSK